MPDNSIGEMEFDGKNDIVKIIRNGVPAVITLKKAKSGIISPLLQLEGSEEDGADNIGKFFGSLKAFNALFVNFASGSLWTLLNHKYDKDVGEFLSAMVEDTFGITERKSKAKGKQNQTFKIRVATYLECKPNATKEEAIEFAKKCAEEDNKKKDEKKAAKEAKKAEDNKEAENA